MYAYCRLFFEGDHSGGILWLPQAGMQTGLVSTSWDHTVRLWDLDQVSEKPLCTFKSHQGYVWCSAYSPSGSFFVSGGADGKVCLYKPPGLDSANEEEDTHVEAG